jgi:uncharacterized membrane protein
MRTKIKKIFLTGIVAIIPVVVSIYIFFFLLGMIDSFLNIIPQRIHPDRLLGFHIPGLGVIFTFLLIFIAGLLTQSYIGGRLLKAGDRLLNQIPLLRSIYQPTKQVVDSLFSDKSRHFRGVVLVEFPRKGVYTLGFVTGDTQGEADRKTSDSCINVFVPTTPNPTSGYYLIMPEKEVVHMDMTVEEAIKIIISSGLVGPQKDNMKDINQSMGKGKETNIKC